MADDYAKWGLTQTNNMIGGEEGPQRDESDFAGKLAQALQARGLDSSVFGGYFGPNDVTPGWQLNGGDPSVMYYPLPTDLEKSFDWLSPQELASVKTQAVNGMIPVKTMTALAQSSPHRAGNPQSGLENLMQGLTIAALTYGFGAAGAGMFGAGAGAAGGTGGINGWDFLGSNEAGGGLTGAEAAGGGGTWNGLPASYNNGQWLANAGETASDAGATNAGTIGGTGMDDWYTELQNLIDNPSGFSTNPSFADLGGQYTADLAGSSTGIMDLAKQLGLNPTSLVKLLATGGGGILGALAGTKPNATTTQTDIPDWLKPYYQSGLGVGLNNLGASQSLSPQETGIINNTVAGLTAPNAGLTAANQAMTDTASGKYLDLQNNPQWQEAMRLLGQNYNETIRPGNDAQFSRAGAMGVGNSAWEEMNARNNRALATGQGAATAGAWGTERQNQMNAAGAMPGFQNQMLTGNANSALGLLGMPRTIANQGLQNYASLLSSTKGPVNQTQTTTANPWQTAAGGAMTGYALSNLWK